MIKVSTDVEIQVELQKHRRFSRSKIKCLACAYRGVMGLLNAKKSPALLVSEKIVYAGLISFFLLSYFAKNETLAYTLRMVLPAFVFVIFICVEQKLKTHTYSCPNCKASNVLQGSK